MKGINWSRIANLWAIASLIALAGSHLARAAPWSLAQDTVSKKSTEESVYLLAADSKPSEL